MIHRKHISGPIVFQNGKEKERARQIGDKITPKNRHCLGRGDGKYNQWNETLRDIPNGKLKIIRNRTRIQTPNLRARKVRSVIKMRVTPKKNPDTSESNGCKPITTNLDGDQSCIPMMKCIPVEKKKKLITQNTSTGRSNRKSRQPSRYKKRLDINVGFKNLFQDSSEEQKTYRKGRPMPRSSKSVVESITRRGNVMRCNTHTELFVSWAVKLSFNRISKCTIMIQFMLVHILYIITICTLD